MRMRVTLDEDVAAAVEQLCRDRSMGVREAVNQLIRAGLQAAPRRRPFRQESQRLGLRIDVNSVGDALDRLEGPLGALRQTSPAWEAGAEARGRAGAELVPAQPSLVVARLAACLKARTWARLSGSVTSATERWLPSRP
jgi:hypothetical protein